MSRRRSRASASEAALPTERSFITSHPRSRSPKRSTWTRCARSRPACGSSAAAAWAGLRGTPARALAARERSAYGRVTLELLSAEGRVLAEARATAELAAAGPQELVRRGDLDTKELHT